MRRLCILMVLFGAAGLASAATNMVTDGGFDRTWIGDENSFITNGNGVVINNRLWEWWGDVSWNLYGWVGGGPNNHGPYYYANGQYGPLKTGRDFTAAPFYGVIPAFAKDEWVIHPVLDAYTPDFTTYIGATVDRVLKTGSTTDYCARARGWETDNYYVTNASVPTGTRVKLQADYIRNGGVMDFTVYGALTADQTRNAYPAWPDAQDVDQNSTPIPAGQPGPDRVCTWPYSPDAVPNSGQTLMTTGALAATAASTWATYETTFFMPAPDAARVVGTGKTQFDYLALRWHVAGDLDLWQAIDNVRMIAIAKGDTNDDEQVNGDDFVTLAVNYTGTGGTGKTWAPATSTRTATSTATISSPWPSTTPAQSTPFPSPSACACWAWAAWRCSAAATNCRISS